MITVTYSNATYSPRMRAFQLDNLSHKLGSYRVPFTRSVREVLAPSIKQNLNDGGRPPWKALKDSTVRRKGHNRPLIRGGKGSKRLSWRASAFARWSFKSNTVEYEMPDVPYFRYQQIGFDHVGGTHVPARPFAMIQPVDRDRVERIFNEWAEETINKAMS